MAKKEKVVEEEFEEFEEDEEEEDKEEEEDDLPTLSPEEIKKARMEKSRQIPVPRPIEQEARQIKKQVGNIPQPQPTQPEYIAVPRVVPASTMLNEIYDGQQEMKQILMALLEKVK